jgi:hypothetical protein
MFRISLRQLLILVAAVALAMVSLKYASPAWQVVLGLSVMLVLFAAVIVAIVDRGPRQAFALGMAVIILGYGLLVANGRQQSNQTTTNVELRASSGHLPTTALLRYLFSSISQVEFKDSTGKVISENEAQTTVSAWQAAMQSGRGAPQMPPLFSEQHPAEEIFTPIGHFWWALLFGYLGGQFARFTYARRIREQPDLAPGE